MLGNDTGLPAGATAVLVTNVTNGTLALGGNGSVWYTPAASFAGTDSFTYRTSSAAGVSPTATVTITVAEPTDVQAPQELRVSSIVGNVVTFRWKVPEIGPDATGFILEGGVVPGADARALPTGSANPIFTVTAPNGSFYVRFKRGRTGRTEFRVERDPAARQPAGGAVGAAKACRRRSAATHCTWAGRRRLPAVPASGVVLDVTGTLSGSVPLSAGELVSIPGVPPGSYTHAAARRERQRHQRVNGAVDGQRPGRLHGGPQPPSNLLAYVLGGITHLVWDSAGAWRGGDQLRHHGAGYRCRANRRAGHLGRTANRHLQHLGAGGRRLRSECTSGADADGALRH